jgi:hypothetical protein
MLLPGLECVRLAAALLGIGLPMPWRFVFAKLLLADVRMASASRCLTERRQAARTPKLGKNEKMLKSSLIKFI